MMEKETLKITEIEVPATMWPLSADQTQLITEKFNLSTEEVNEIQYPWELLNLLREKLFSSITESEIHPSAEISPKAHIEGPVFIEEGVKILPFAVVIGPCFIGKNTLVGNHTQIRHSYIGENSLVGGGNEIIRSICLDNTSFHRNYIGDSFIMSNVSFGGDAGTANKRSDQGEILCTTGDNKIPTGLFKLGAIIGENTVIAGKAMFMPGIIIGADCFIGPGASVYSNVPDNSRVTVKQTQFILKNNANYKK